MANSLKVEIEKEVEKKAIEIQEAKYAKQEQEEKIDVTAQFPSQNL
ncbi:MAG: hypothetical protein Q8M44_02170 [bacterium]|nr:hypothetical protein [bacterium]